MLCSLHFNAVVIPLQKSSDCSYHLPLVQCYGMTAVTNPWGERSFSVHLGSPLSCAVPSSALWILAAQHVEGGGVCMCPHYPG